MSLLGRTLIKNAKKTMQDFQNIINKQGKLHLPMKIFKSKVFLTDEYLP